jgi:exodeoxyribonuclease V gamma subunit
MRSSARPDANALHARLVARAQVALGADGRAQVAEVLEDVAPFAELALKNGFGDRAKRRPLSDLPGLESLRGALDGVHAPGALRVVLRPDGVHGGHVVRHGLDAFVASLLGVKLYVLARSEKGAAPELKERELAKPAQAAAALDALFAWHDAARRTPLPFLPKSGYEFYKCLGENDSDGASVLQEARRTWTGASFDGGGHPEASPATRIALRGSDPFYDEDASAQMRFGKLAEALFSSFKFGEPLDPAVFG